MKIGSKEWETVIIDGAKDLGVPIDETAAAHFAMHASELVKWTRISNLTTITDPLDIAVKHFIDSLAAVPHIPRESAVLDIGSGGGFPGLPIKVTMQTLHMTLIDGSRKKVTFLQYMIRKLGLAQTRAEHIRAEAMGSRENKNRSFDVIISRALGNFDSLLKMALPLITPNGKIIAYRGKTNPVQRGSDYQLAIHTYRLPHADSERSLVIVRPNPA